MRQAATPAGGQPDPGWRAARFFAGRRAPSVASSAPCSGPGSSGGRCASASCRCPSPVRSRAPATPERPGRPVRD